MNRFIFVAAFVALPSLAAASDCSLLNAQQRQGLVCDAPSSVSQVLSSAPEVPPATAPCFDPYSLGRCVDTAAYEPAATAFVPGQCYHGLYMAFTITVVSVAPSRLRPGAQLVSAEWLPSLGSNVVGPVSFYTDVPVMQFFPMACPAPIARVN